MADIINITLSFDKGYSEQATVMLYSLLENNQTNTFKIFAFYNDLDTPAKTCITSNLSRFANFDLEWIKIEGSLIKGFFVIVRIAVPETT